MLSSSVRNIVQQYRQWARHFDDTLHATISETMAATAASTTDSPIAGTGGNAPIGKERRAIDEGSLDAMNRRFVLKQRVFKVHRNHKGAVLNYKHNMSWPKRADGMFVPQVYVTAIGGGSGGDAARYNISTSSPDSIQFYPDPKCISALWCTKTANGKPGVGGASGGAIVAFPLTCPASVVARCNARGSERQDDECFSINMEIEVGVGGAKGKTLVRDDAQSQDGNVGADAGIDASMAIDSCIYGTPGTPSRVTVDGLSAIPPATIATPCDVISADSTVVVSHTRLGGDRKSTSSEYSVENVIEWNRFPRCAHSVNTETGVCNVSAVFQPLPGFASQSARQSLRPLDIHVPIQTGFAPLPSTIKVECDAAKREFGGAIPSDCLLNIAFMCNQSIAAPAMPDALKSRGFTTPVTQSSVMQTWHGGAEDALNLMHNENDDMRQYVSDAGGAGALAPFNLQRALTPPNDQVADSVLSPLMDAGNGGSGGAVPIFHLGHMDGAPLKEEEAELLKSFFNPIEAQPGEDGIVIVYWLDTDE